MKLQGCLTGTKARVGDARRGCSGVGDQWDRIPTARSGRDATLLGIFLVIFFGGGFSFL